MSTKGFANFISDLMSDDVTVRRHAAQMLADSDERAIYPLIKALRDANPGVQDAAMHSLISIGGEIVAYMVVPLLRDDSFLRNTALLILRELGTVSVPLIYPLLRDKDEDIRKFALDLLGDIRTGVQYDEVIPMLKDENANVRVSAVRTIGILMDKRGLKYIASALADVEWVCFAALEALGERGDHSVVPDIVKLLDHESEAIRLAALETLGRIGASEAADDVLKHISASASAEERQEAVKALVKIGITPSMKDISDSLMVMFNQGLWEDRMIALKGLSDLNECFAISLVVDIAGVLDPSVPGDEEKLLEIRSALRRFDCEDELVAVLEDSTIKFKGRVLAAEAAGETRNKKAVPVLINMLSGDLRDVRRAAAQALGKIGTPEAREALVNAVSDKESNVRKMAICCLGQMPDKASFDPLLKHLDDEPYNDIVEEAIKALLKIDPARVYTLLDGFNDRLREAVGRFATDIDILIKLSMDTNLSVKLSALGALGKIKDEKASRRIIEATKEEDPEVRRAAVIALGGMDIGQDSIKSLLRDGDMWVRLHAVRSLGQSLRQDMVETLSPMLRDDEIPVVLAAIESISLIGGRDAFRALAGINEHPDEAVRMAVREAMERF